MKRFLSRYWLVLVAVSLAAFALFCASRVIEINQRLWASCLADGHKDYECASMLRERR